MRTEEYGGGILLLVMIAIIIVGVPWAIYRAITNDKTYFNAEKICSPYQVETYNDNVIFCKGPNGYENKTWPVEKE